MLKILGNRASQWVIWIALSIMISAPAPAQTWSREANTDYYGGDYTSFVPQKPTPNQCMVACERDRRCLAYTFVRPRAGSPLGRCYLKSQLGKRSTSTCCISGRKTAPRTAQPQTKIKELTADIRKKSPLASPNSAVHPNVQPMTIPGPANRAPSNASATHAKIPQNQSLLPAETPAVRFPEDLARRLRSSEWLHKFRTYSADRKIQRIPLSPREQRVMGLGPVQRSCPPSEGEAAKRARQDRIRQDIYQKCLSASTRGSGDIPSWRQVDDCNRIADDESLRQVNPSVDADGDGAYDICTGGTDCDDSDPNRYPGNPEITDPSHRDEDCNPRTLGHEDRDGDGFISNRSCNLSWDGLVCGSDCNDNDASIHPGQVEVCNGRDDNCNGDVDEGVLHTLFLDSDRDLFGDPVVTEFRCRPGPDENGRGVWVYDNSDCNDRDPAVNPRNGNCPGRAR